MAKTIIPYKGIVLEFDEGRHRFTIDGRNILSVTGVTSVIDKSRQLMSWQERITREALIGELEGGGQITQEFIEKATALHRTEKQKAATIGDTVHEFAEHFSLGLKPDIPDSEQARNGCLAFLKWIESEGMKLRNPEQLVYSKKYDYAGIADAEGISKRKLYLLDYKTSKGVYPEMKLQVSAYLHALVEMKKGKYEGTWILRFDKESGDFEPVFIDLKDSKKNFQAFLGALALRKRLKEIDTYGR